MLVCNIESAYVKDHFACNLSRHAMQDIFQGISELRRFAFMLSCVVRFPNPNHCPARHYPPTTGTPKVTTIKLFLPVKLYYRLPQQEQNRTDKPGKISQHCPCLWPSSIHPLVFVHPMGNLRKESPNFWTMQFLHVHISIVHSLVSSSYHIWESTDDCQSIRHNIIMYPGHHSFTHALHKNGQVEVPPKGRLPLICINA